MAGIRASSGRVEGGAPPPDDDRVAAAGQGESAPPSESESENAGPTTQGAPPGIIAGGSRPRAPVSQRDVGSIFLDKSLGDKIADLSGAPEVSAGEARRLGQRSQPDLYRLVENTKAAGYGLAFKDPAERQKFGLATLNLKAGKATEAEIDLVADVIHRSDVRESMALKRGGLVLEKDEQDVKRDKDPLGTRVDNVMMRGGNRVRLEEAWRLGQRSQAALATLVRNIGVDQVRSNAAPILPPLSEYTHSREDIARILKAQKETPAKFDAAWSRLEAGEATPADIGLIAGGVGQSPTSGEWQAGVLEARKAPPGPDPRTVGDFRAGGGPISLDKSLGDKMADGVGTARVSSGEAKRLGERSQQDLARLVDNARAAGYALELKDAAERQRFGVAALSLKSGTASAADIELVAKVIDRSNVAESLATARGGVVLEKTKADRKEDGFGTARVSKAEALRLGRTSQEALTTLVRNIGVESVRSVAVPGKSPDYKRSPEDLRRFDAAWSRLQGGKATEQDLQLIAEGFLFFDEHSAGVLDRRKAPE